MLDMRTRAGQEEAVLAKIRLDGGFSVFWATDNIKRANAIMRLQNAGRIVRVRPADEAFPRCTYRIARGRRKL